MTRTIASLPFALALVVGCGGEDPKPPEVEAPIPSVPPWVGTWPLAYQLDLRSAVELPDAALEAHPFRRAWPVELSWLRPVAEPLLEAWLRAELSGGLSDFFAEVEALPSRLEDASLQSTLALAADGEVEETWEALSLPDACAGDGLQVELEDFRTTDGRWWIEGARVRVERRLRFRAEVVSRRLLDGLARCSGATSVDELLDRSLACRFDGWASELQEVAGLLCAGLREAWRDKYTPRGEVHAWTLHQGLTPGPLRNGGEELLVTATEADSAPRFRSWRLR